MNPNETVSDQHHSFQLWHVGGSSTESLDHWPVARSRRESSGKDGRSLRGKTKMAPSGDGAISSQSLLVFLAVAIISFSVALAVVALAIAFTVIVFFGHKVLPLKFRALLLIDQVFLLTIIP